VAAWYPIIALLVAAIWLLIAALSYRRAASQPWWPALIMIVACMFCWNVGYFLQQVALDSNAEYVTSLMIEASKLMVAAGALHFMTSLNRAATGWRAVVAGIGYLLAAALFLGGHIPSVQALLSGTDPGWDAVPVVYVVVACGIAVGLQVFELEQATSPLDRSRIKYVLFASAVVAAGYGNDVYTTIGIPTWSLGNVTAAFFGLPTWSLGNVSAVFCGAMGVYVMTGERLIPISTVFRNIRHVVAALVLISAAFLALLTVGRDTVRPWLVAVPVAVVVTLYLLFLVRHRLFEIGERMLFWGRYQFRRTLNVFEAQIADMESAREMVAKLLELLTEELGVEHALLIAGEDIEPLFVGLDEPSFRGSVVGEHIYAFREVRLLEVLKRAGGPILRQDVVRNSWASEHGIEFDISAMGKILERMHCELLLPLTAGDRLLGALGIGEKASGDVYSNEEIGALRELAAHIGLYLENARINYRAQQTDRMISLRKMADRIVERLRKRVETLRETVEPLEPTEPLDPETLASLRHDLAHVHDVVDALRRFSLPPAVKPVRSEVPSVVSRVLEGYRWSQWFERVEIETQFDDDLPSVFIDPAQFGRALEAVVLNACESIGNCPGTVTISAFANIDSPRPHVRIDVADTGPGVGSEDAAKIFDPLYSTKPGHLGVGLSVAYALLRQNNCSVSVSTNSPDGGAMFTIRCPLWAIPIEPKEI